MEMVSRGYALLSFFSVQHVPHTHTHTHAAVTKNNKRKETKRENGEVRRVQTCEKRRGQCDRKHAQKKKRRRKETFPRVNKKEQNKDIRTKKKTSAALDRRQKPKQQQKDRQQGRRAVFVSGIKFLRSEAERGISCCYISVCLFPYYY
jgi:hypothetical protein